MEPPASGRIALFSTAIEFAVFSSPLPVVAAGEVVQAVSGFSTDAAVDWAVAVPTLSTLAIIAAATRIISPMPENGGSEKKRSGVTLVPATVIAPRGARSSAQAISSADDGQRRQCNLNAI